MGGLLLATLAASAAIDPSDGYHYYSTYYACSLKDYNKLRLVPATTNGHRTRCRSDEFGVKWANGRVGPRGPAGPAGPRGLRGLTGDTGPAGPGGVGLLRSQLTLGVGVPLVLSGDSYGFDQPTGVAFDGRHLWIANYGGRSVTDVDASDGAWVRTFGSANFGFNYPEGITFDGFHLWITNIYGNSVTAIQS